MHNTDINSPSFTPSEFLNVVNQTLEYAYSEVTIVGEVASFKVNQGKWVFFDLKDEESSIGCFMTLWNLRQPLEDGMKVAARGVPKVTKWGKFSFTVEKVMPIGEGSLKKAYEILKKKLAAEGLFDASRKRALPEDLTKLGVISSVQAAGYTDFIKILNARWGGINIQVAHTQVQGLDAPDQIMRALNYFNERGEVQVIAILRGGGSADDLACFNDEALARAIASSKIPVICGIGHEVDESLCDLVCDVRASTPSNAAEILTKDRMQETAKLVQIMNRVTSVLSQEIVRITEANCRSIEEVSHWLVRERVEPTLENNKKIVLRLGQGLIHKYIEPMLVECDNKKERIQQKIQEECQNLDNILQQKLKLLEMLNPERVLAQGYAIISGEIFLGNVVKITTFKEEIEAEVKRVKQREK